MMTEPARNAIEKMVTDFASKEFPANSGVILYGSCLFEVLSLANDIDVVVLTNNHQRKRLRTRLDGKDTHVSLLSYDVFERDALESAFGEYYLNKLMNPCRVLIDSPRIYDAITLVRTAIVKRVLETMQRISISFSTIDFYMYLTYLRMLRFPHFASTVVRLFANPTTEPMKDTLASYERILANCVQRCGDDLSVESLFVVHDAGLMSREKCSRAVPVDFRIVPRYWEVFNEVHERHEGIQAYCHRHLSTLLRLGEQCSSVMKTIVNSPLVALQTSHE